MDNETLLIVEDNIILRNGLQEMLVFEGYQVLVASNGREALELMKRLAPDLILSDITMPVMDGFTFFRQVRSKPEWVAIPFLYLTARGERQDILTSRGLGAEDYLVKPVTREELLAAVQSRLARAHQLQMVQLQQAYESTLTMLVNAIEVRSEYTRSHVERVTAYAMILAEFMNLQGKRLQHLRFGSILHDVGKIHIPKEILTKKERLTEEEWALIRTHPVTGAEMLKNISYLQPALPVVRHHHERWDGQGYPDGLSGEQIPLEARIVSVADGFDAMSTDRPYQVAYRLEDAAAEILACAGTQFDPAVAGAFQQAWQQGKIHEVIKQLT